MSADEALLAIQELMDGVEWTPDTLAKIAEILISAGCRDRRRPRWSLLLTHT